MKTELLPPNILKCMSKSDRKGVLTREEIDLRKDWEFERDLHKHTENLLRQRNIVFTHARFGKKSPLPAGWPDFELRLAPGRSCFIELKTIHGVISKEQHAMMEKL